jgi:hypothetical protein
MLSNTAMAENQPVTFAIFPVENRHDDPFTVHDERYVGHDGFVVPRTSTSSTSGSRITFATGSGSTRKNQPSRRIWRIGRKTC